MNIVSSQPSAQYARRNKAGPVPVRGSEEGPDAMIAAFGTLAFLASLWLLVVVGAAVLEESGTKIAAALKGEARLEPRPAPVRIRARAGFASNRPRAPARLPPAA